VGPVNLGWEPAPQSKEASPLRHGANLRSGDLFKEVQESVLAEELVGLVVKKIRLAQDLHVFGIILVQLNDAIDEGLLAGEIEVV
jgi:hypothetical protein